jgi:hypothetical protein
MPVGDSEHLKFVCLHLGAVRRTEGVNLRRRRGVFVGDSRWGRAPRQLRLRRWQP